MSQKTVPIQTKVDVTSFPYTVSTTQSSYPIVKPVTATSSIARQLASIPLAWDLGTPTWQDVSVAEEGRESVYLMDPTTSLVLYLLLGDTFSNMLYAKPPHHPACNSMHRHLICGHLIGLSYPILSCKKKGRREKSFHL